jgi:AraC-like DNA-binding protein
MPTSRNRVAVPRAPVAGIAARAAAVTYDSMHAFYSGTLGRPLAGGAGPSEGVTAHRLEHAHPEAPYVSPRFRTTYYSIVCIRAGAGSYFLDERAYPTRDRTVYFTNPGHLKGFASDVPPSGAVVTFSDAFLRRHLRGDVLDVFPYLVTEAVAPLVLDAGAFARLEALTEPMLAEYESDPATEPRRIAVIAHLLIALLHRLGTLAAAAGAWHDVSGEGSALVTRFRADLAAAVRDLAAGRERRAPTVRALAARQGLHPSYLTTVIGRRTGRTAHAWIAERMLAEAQSLLARGDLSVKAVAERIGFDEPNHLSRFFRRHGGVSPSAYRAAHRAAHPPAPADRTARQGG